MGNFLGLGPRPSDPPESELRQASRGRRRKGNGAVAMGNVEVECYVSAW